MNVTVKELEKSEVELTIEVGVEEAKPQLDAAVQRISQEVAVKGFRKGKAPYDVLAKTVGEATIYQEAFNAIVEAAYPKALDQHPELQIVGRASIDVVKLAPNNPIVFTATVPVLPTVQLGKLKKLTARKQLAQFDDTKYQKTLDDLRKMQAKEVLVDRVAKTGDKAIIDFEVKVGGVAIDGGSGYKQGIVLGEGKFIPGFEDNIVGLQKGDEKDFQTSFPTDYFKKDLQGKQADVHIVVHDIYEVELPELDDDFAKNVNFESVKELQDEIRKNIERELEEKAQAEYENAVIDELLESSTMAELSTSLIDDEAGKMLGELETDIAQQGLQFADYLQHIGKTEAELRDSFTPQATKRIQAAVLLRQLAKDLDITADPAEIDAEIAELKKLYEHVPGMADQVDTPAQRARTENQLIHKKTFQAIAAQSK